MIVDPLRSIPGRQSSAQDWSARAKQGDQPPASIGVFLDQMSRDTATLTYPWFWRDFDTIWNNRMTTLGSGGSPGQILQSIQDDANKAARRG